jgi:proteasome inhibitor subunit 1 (PI31)
MSQFKTQIVQKLIPSLQKDGYSEVQNSNSETPLHARPQPQAPFYVPGGSSSRRPTHENPLQIGRRDLDPIPMNPHDLFSPPSLFPHNSGDGMFVGPDHPIFGMRGGGSYGRGPWGGDGFLPPLGAPPGARFDPVGPFGDLGGRGRGRPPGGGNMRGPDNDEFMPPGMV